MTDTYPPPATRRLITLSIMAAAIMNQVDTTIANVALPHMQGSTSASREQITWVLTSYIIALAIFTPLTGWLAGKFGRRRLLLSSIAAFTFFSLLCGISTTLDELILFRVLQGASGSALVPMSQATLFDINPPEEHGKAMSVFGLAGILGPLAGPLLGGWLTENFSWHWVFLINLPIGVAAFIGLTATMPESRETNPRPFDMFGFLSLAVGIGALQLLLDRGQMLDWFQSWEICIEATVAATALSVFLIHVLTVPRPFIQLAIFKDRNFVICTLIGFSVGVMLFGTSSLLPPLLTGLFAYPVIEVGLVMAPRGLGNVLSTPVVGLVINRIDPRVLVFIGMATCAGASYELSHMSLESGNWPVMVAGFLNGVGTTLIFIPLSTMAFATLPRELRNDGAAINTLIRYLGSAVGISMLQILTYRNEAVVQSRLTETVRPDNPVFDLRMPWFDPTAPDSLARVDFEIVRQAMMVSYIDAFWALFLVSVCFAPLIFLLRIARAEGKEAKAEQPALHAAAD